MKKLLALSILVAAIDVAPAIGQTLDFTDAVSRRVVVVVKDAPVITDAVSRRLIFTNYFRDPITDASSRRHIFTNAYRDAPNDTVSRLVTAELAAYAASDVLKALRIAAGLLEASASSSGRLNVNRSGDSAARVDLRDAARIARMAMGLDP